MGSFDAARCLEQLDQDLLDLRIKVREDLARLGSKVHGRRLGQHPAFSTPHRLKILSLSTGSQRDAGVVSS